MSIECITCGKKSEKKKEFFELAGSSGATLWNHICKECAKEIGINNFMKAGFSRKISVMKKYVKIHPEAQYRLDILSESLEFEKKEIREGFKSIVINSKYKYEKYSKYTKRKQIKCTCCSCGNVFYYGDFEILKNVNNILHANIYSMNQFKDLDQCPKCGSRAITKKDEYYFVDKNGNYMEENS